MTLYEFLKSIILVLIFATITPFLMRNITSQYKLFLEPSTYIGIIPIKGYIIDSSFYIKQLNIFFKDPFIKGILFKIDCYESAAGSTQNIFNEIQQLKKVYPKPLITLVENTCIAGAYLIASASDYIIAPETAIIGGIGSYARPGQLEDLFTLYGIRPSAPCITTTTDYHNATSYNETYQQFTKHVATTRKLSLATVSNWANEKIFTGKQAYNLGLINALGSLHTVVTLLKEKALIDSEIEWVEHEVNHYSLFQSALSPIINSIVSNKNPKVVSL